MRERGPKVYGPYHRPARRGPNKWELIIREGPERIARYYGTKEEALGDAEKIRASSSSYSLSDALEDYREYLVKKGNKSRSITSTMSRLNVWLSSEELAITEHRLRSVYSSRSNEVSVDTARNELAEVKTFFRWLVKQKVLRTSPAEGIDGIGRRKKGKPQLRQSEAQRFAVACVEAYEDGGPGSEAALANLMALVLGMRASEICSLRARDVDFHDGGCTVWVTDGKTDAAQRRLEVPLLLQSMLEAQLATARRAKSEWLFPAQSGSGHRERTWIRKAARRIALAAKVPYAPPHGLRGTCATLASDAGEAAWAVARQLGHNDTRTTKEHYMEHGAIERASAATVAQKVVVADGDAHRVPRYKPALREDTRYAKASVQMIESNDGKWVRWDSHCRAVRMLLDRIAELETRIENGKV